MEGDRGTRNEETYVRFTEQALEGIGNYPSTPAWLEAEWAEAQEVIAHPLYENMSGIPNTYDSAIVMPN